METPFVGKVVVVVGTSRDELNGSTGLAQDYDKDKGRYTVRLSNGQTVALKPANLKNAPPGTAPPPVHSSGNSGGQGAYPKGLFGLTWQQAGILALLVGWILNQSGLLFGTSSSAAPGVWGGANSEDAEYDDNDEGYLKGQVKEITTLDQLRGVLAYHGDSTGLPVVVDFFSHSCGPCRMIAPTFKRTAVELKGRAVFVKVDVNRNYEASSACGVRGLPTFQFYLDRKQVFQFSGADEHSLRRYARSYADQASDAGTYVGQMVTVDSLRAFYKVHDPSKDVSELSEKYASKTALLMRVCRKKYGSVPELSNKINDVERRGSNSEKGHREKSRSNLLSDYALEELEAELLRRRDSQKTRGQDGDDEEFSFGSPASEGGDDMVHKVVIVGGGPAGLAAATYAARAGLRPLIVAPAFGGQLLGKGVDVENYPGVVGEHATGPGLVGLMRRQAHSFGARFVDAAVLGVNFSRRPLRIRANGTDKDILSDSVILASGAVSRWLHVDGEQEFRGRGVSSCAVCDGFTYRETNVAIIGGGDHAMEDALHLARTSRQVTLVHRGARFRASKVLADRVLGHPSIRVRWNSTVRSFHGADVLTHLLLDVSSSSIAKEKLQVDGAFVAIGHIPQTDFVRGQVDLDRNGYVALRDRTLTSALGVFAAGDVADHTYRQAATASGSGVMAALDVERFLLDLR